MNVCFCGLNPGAMTSYPLGIAFSIMRQNPEARFTFVYETPGVVDGRELPPRSEVIPMGAPTARRAREIVSAADVLVTTAQRLPDSALVAAAHEAGIPSVMFQHGLLVEFMRREPTFLIRKARKTVRFLRFATAIAEIHRRSRLQYASEFGRVFLSGRSYRDAAIDHDRINVDTVLLNGEIWRDFHTCRYGYESEAQRVVGYPDFEQLDAIEREPREEGICYVAQTLVEHGRLSRTMFDRFLDMLLRAADGKKLVLKLHPASDRGLFERALAEPNVEVRQDRLPNFTHYVGHYSTYLALIPFLSRLLYLWSFEGHETPDFLRSAAWQCGDDELGLRRFAEIPASESSPDQARLAALQQHFWRNPRRSPFDEAASAILQAVERR